MIDGGVEVGCVGEGSMNDTRLVVLSLFSSQKHADKSLVSDKRKMLKDFIVDIYGPAGLASC